VRNPSCPLVPGWAGRGGVAGHAVNPSLEAPSPLSRVRNPAHSARPGLGVLPSPSDACVGPMRLRAPQPNPYQPPTHGWCPQKRQSATALPAFARRFSLATGPLSREGVWDPERHGWRDGAYTDVLAACPANPHAPAQPGSRRQRPLSGFGFWLLTQKKTKKKGPAMPGPLLNLYYQKD
jgi:hypothetical protein